MQGLTIQWAGVVVDMHTFVIDLHVLTNLVGLRLV